MHSNQSDGFIHDVRKLLAKNGLSDYLVNYAKFAVFPSKYIWKRTVNAAVRNNAVTERNQRMLADEQFSRFRQIHMENNPAFPYSISKSTTDIIMAKHYIKLWIRIPYKDSFLCTYTYCNIVTNDTPVHIVTICRRFESLRNSFLNAVRERHGTELYEELSQTTPELLFLKIIGAPTTTITTEMNTYINVFVCCNASHCLLKDLRLYAHYLVLRATDTEPMCLPFWSDNTEGSDWSS